MKNLFNMNTVDKWFNRTIEFLLYNKVFFIFLLISLGSFFYSLDALRPYKDYTKRKEVVFKVVKHLGLSDGNGYIKIQNGSFVTNKNVAEYQYFQYEDGKSYYFNFSEKEMFPNESKDKVVDKTMGIFFIVQLLIVLVSLFGVFDGYTEYVIMIFLPLILMAVFVVNVY